MRKKLSELELLEETKEILATFPKTEEAIQTFVLCRTLQLTSIYSFFMKASRKRHESQFEKIVHLKKLTENLQNPQGNQSFDSNLQNKLFDHPNASGLRPPAFRLGRDLKDVGLNDSGFLASGEKKTIHNPRNILSRRYTQPEAEGVESMHEMTDDKIHKIGVQELESNLLAKKSEPVWFRLKRSSFDDGKLRKVEITAHHLINESSDALDNDTSILAEDLKRIYGRQNADPSNPIERRRVSQPSKESKTMYPTGNQPNLFRRQSSNLDSPTVTPRNISKLTSLLQLEPKYLVLSTKTEIRKNQMEKIYHELLVANASIQQSRNLYYQTYMDSKLKEEEKRKKQSKVLVEKDAKNICRSQLVLKSANEQQQLSPLIVKTERKNADIEPITKAYRPVKLLATGRDHTPLIKKPTKERTEDSFLGHSHRDKSAPTSKGNLSFGTPDDKYFTSNLEPNTLPKPLKQPGVGPKLPNVTLNKLNITKEAANEKYTRNNVLWTPVRETRRSSLRTSLEELSEITNLKSANEAKINTSFQDSARMKQIALNQGDEKPQVKQITMNKFMKHMNECERGRTATADKRKTGREHNFSGFPGFASQTFYDRMRFIEHSDKQEIMRPQGRVPKAIVPVEWQEMSVFHRPFINFG